MADYNGYKCAVCGSHNELNHEGLCGICAMVREANKIGVSYGKLANSKLMRVDPITGKRKETN